MDRILSFVSVAICWNT